MRKLTLAVGVAMLSTIGLFATSHAGDTSATMEKMKGETKATVEEGNDLYERLVTMVVTEIEEALARS